MQKIETLKNKSGESIYPLTSTKAVVDENGNTIEYRLVVADGEDLVTDGNVLRLKDRPNTDGMGYVILRKDKTFQEQVTKPNTIYEIRYDFDLNGAEITIPENCVLKFEGGSLGNGTVILQNTFIETAGQSYEACMACSVKGGYAVGQYRFDKATKSPSWWNGTEWVGPGGTASGSTAARPSNAPIGTQYFDTTLGMPIWWTGAKWVDALGRLAGDTYNEVRHNINGTEIKVISTDAESQGLSIYAPTELQNDGYVVVQQDNKAKFVDPADIGLK